MFTLLKYWRIFPTPTAGKLIYDQKEPKNKPPHQTPKHDPHHQATTQHMILQQKLPTHKHNRHLNPTIKHTEAESSQSHKEALTQKLLHSQQDKLNRTQTQPKTSTILKSTSTQNYCLEKIFRFWFAQKTAKFAKSQQQLKKVLQLLEVVSKKSVIASNGDFRRYLYEAPIFSMRVS